MLLLGGGGSLQKNGTLTPLLLTLALSLAFLDHHCLAQLRCHKGTPEFPCTEPSECVTPCNPSDELCYALKYTVDGVVKERRGCADLTKSGPCWEAAFKTKEYGCFKTTAGAAKKALRSECDAGEATEARDFKQIDFSGVNLNTGGGSPLINNSNDNFELPPDAKDTPTDFCTCKSDGCNTDCWSCGRGASRTPISVALQGILMTTPVMTMALLYYSGIA